MTKPVRLIGMVALAALLAACHRGQDISFDGHSITLHSAGEPAATITSQGSFSVGSKLIDATPAQRQLFLRYYNQVTAIHADTGAITGAALHLAGNSIKQAVGLAGNASTGTKADTQATQEDQGQALKQRALKLCQEVKEAQALQATLSGVVPAFKPYADIDPAPDVHC